MRKNNFVYNPAFGLAALAVALAVFQIVFIWQDNSGFAFPVYVIFAYLLLTSQRFQYTPGTLWQINLISFLHLVGGLRLNETENLYYYYFIRLNEHFFRYDQLVHFLAGLVVTNLTYQVCQTLIPKQKRKFGRFWILIVLGSMGVAAFHEITEFLGSQLFFQDGAGGYVNNLFDLTNHFIASILAASFLYFQYVRNNQST
jgi:uncharacterized membrane protein YjdF